MKTARTFLPAALLLFGNVAFAVEASLDRGDLPQGNGGQFVRVKKVELSAQGKLEASIEGHNDCFGIAGTGDFKAFVVFAVRDKDGNLLTTASTPVFVGHEKGPDGHAKVSGYQFSLQLDAGSASGAAKIDITVLRSGEDTIRDKLKGLVDDVADALKKIGAATAMVKLK